MARTVADPGSQRGILINGIQMKMRRIVFFILSFLLVPLSSWAQKPLGLSEEGARSWKTAMDLLDMADSADDLMGPIKEFEKVTVSDPAFADAYFNLGKLYTRYGKKKGPQFLDKAREYFLTYIRLRPDDKKAAEDELYLLNAVRESAINSLSPEEKAKWGFSQFEGTWEGCGIRLTFTGFDVEEDNSLGIGSCRVFNNQNADINCIVWDSYTDAVIDVRDDNRINNVYLRHDGKEFFWRGRIFYNSHSSANRRSITDYKTTKSMMDYDTMLSKYYTATVSNNDLFIKCKTTCYELKTDSYGRGAVGDVRSEDTKVFILTRKD